MTETDYDWRHGWIPLTMRAAMQKTHGNHEAAEELLEERAARRRGRRSEFVSPHPRHRAEHEERRHLASLSDDDLADQLGAAADDEAAVARIVRELDRRDQAEQKVARARERRRARRTAEEERRTSEFDAACDAGEDPEAAYRRVYGVSEERQRQQAAAEDLRAAGFAGKTFRDLVSSAHAEHVGELYRQAEEECRGHLLSPAGKRAGVDPVSLFSGPAARAKKYGSEELMSWFRDNGRATRGGFRRVAARGPREVPDDRRRLVNTTTAAGRMGARAGQRFRSSGVPTRNPFPSQLPRLAAAWRRAYLAAVGSGRSE